MPKVPKVSGSRERPNAKSWHALDTCSTVPPEEQATLRKRSADDCPILPAWGAEGAKVTSNGTAQAPLSKKRVYHRLSQRYTYELSDSGGLQNL